MVSYSFVFAAAAAVTMVSAMPTQSYGEQSGSYQPSESSKPWSGEQGSYGQNQGYVNGQYKPDHRGDYKPDHRGDYKPDHRGDYKPDHSGDYKPDHSGDYTPSKSGDYQPPTNTYNADPNRATHRVIAGFNGLHFEPENIVAEIGDLVEVHFNPMNHSFAQSSFDKPCAPINDNAIFSGFQPTTSGEAKDVFTIEVKDKKPLWFYCSQTKGDHCQMGMAMAVNQNFDSDKTLANYKLAAAKTGTSISPPKPGNGGKLGPAPNGPGL